MKTVYHGCIFICFITTFLISSYLCGILEIISKHDLLLLFEICVVIAEATFFIILVILGGNIK